MSIHGSHVFNCDLKRSLKYMILTVFLTASVTYFKPPFHTAPTSQRSWFESRSGLNFSGFSRYYLGSAKNCKDHAEKIVSFCGSNIRISCINNRYIDIIVYMYTYGLVIDPHNEQLQVDLVAQLVEDCTGISEMEFESRSGLKFSGVSRHCLSTA